MTGADKLTTELSQLCALLQQCHFGIGGSCLLWQLGFDVTPNDIDIVCTEADFSVITELLGAEGYQQQIVPAQAEFATAYFARWQRSGSYSIDVMAGIAVRRQDQLIHWAFTPQHCHWQNGICWMPPADWLQLYQLFNRPQRVALLRQHLVKLRLNSLS
jgi:hypothetical protein